MTDLTKITTPYGLLDKATQDALKAHPGPIEFYNQRGWEPVIGKPCWNEWLAYRAKPAPREWWVNEYDDGLGALLSSIDEADTVARFSWGHKRIRLIHVREVLE